MIKVVAVKYSFEDEKRARIRRAVRVTKTKAIMILTDADIQGMSEETELVVGVRSVGGDRGYWQLEVCY